jgi:Tripartite ATP-independent periplasmic transporter, DctM component
MLLLVLLFTVIGDFIEPVPTIIIFMPLVNALTQAADINAVHMGVVLIATLAFGLITPPYGLVLLMASKFIGVRFSQALRAAPPIYVVFLATITFCIYFPTVVLWLPKQVIPESVGCFKGGLHLPQVTNGEQRRSKVPAELRRLEDALALAMAPSKRQASSAARVRRARARRRGRASS